MSIELVILWAGVLTLLSVLASKISDRFALPALLLFLVIGMLAGSEGVGGIYFNDPGIAKSVGVIALVFIIFSGGLDTSWKSVRPLFGPGLVLSTAGVLITAVVVGFFAMALLRFSFLEGLLLGSIVSSTDAAAVFSILRSRKISLKGALKPLLELESGSNDPMAVFLTVGCLGLLTQQAGQAWYLAPMFVLNMGAGLAMGYAMSRVAVFLLNASKLEYEGLYPVMSIGLVLLTYAAATFIHGNGFLAVYMLGLLMRRKDFKYKNSLVRFHEGIAWLMQIAMFLTLGLLVFPSEIVPVMGKGMLIALILMFLARPVSVLLCLAPFKFSLPEKAMVSWVGLRGSVPIILATFPLLAGAAQAHPIFNIVFFIVLTSVLIQGTSIPAVSRLLGVDAPMSAKRAYPIELEQTGDLDASLDDMIVAYRSAAVGKTIAALNVPPKALIVLLTRDDKFIVPNGSTVIEAGDVLLVLANNEDRRTLEAALAQLSPAGDE